MLSFSLISVSDDFVGRYNGHSVVIQNCDILDIYMGDKRSLLEISENTTEVDT